MNPIMMMLLQLMMQGQQQQNMPPAPPPMPGLPMGMIPPPQQPAMPSPATNFPLADPTVMQNGRNF